jgi:hypothetical protein
MTMTEVLDPQFEAMMKAAEPKKEHHWLRRLVGEWTYETEMGEPGGTSAEKFLGTERVRAIGEIWIVAESEGSTPGGVVGTSVVTLGFNPQTGRFVSTFLSSMMTHLWVCDGELDADERVLTLSAEGPSFETEGKTAQYRDVIEIHSDDYRTLKAYVLGEDGEWNWMMESHYRRTA